MNKRYPDYPKVKQFTVHDTEFICEKKGEVYKYSIGFVANKKLNSEQIKDALEVIKNMVRNKL